MTEPGPKEDLHGNLQEARDALVWKLDGLYHRSWANSDATIRELPLDAIGHVPWWGKHGEVTLHKILVHMIAETHRHAGHADIIRELIDGAAGVSEEYDNLPPGDRTWWDSYRARLEDAARQAAQR